VGNAWLDYQVASKAIPRDTVVLVTDHERRFVATTANAREAFGVPSLVGLRIDDVTASYARAVVPELWGIFDANGSMEGDYDCERGDHGIVSLPFHGVWGRPLPDLQVGYLQTSPDAPAMRTRPREVGQSVDT
jgi:hypothetical protein